MENDKPEAGCTDDKRNKLASRTYDIDVDDMVPKNCVLYREDGITSDPCLVTVFFLVLEE